MNSFFNRTGNLNASDVDDIIPYRIAPVG